MSLSPAAAVDGRVCRDWLTLSRPSSQSDRLGRYYKKKTILRKITKGTTPHKTTSIAIQKKMVTYKVLSTGENVRTKYCASYEESGGERVKNFLS